MGWNHPNPIYMYPRRKKRLQCNKCKYKLGNLCYQRKYQDYNYAELEGTTKRNCKYFEEKEKDPYLRKKEIEQLRPSFKQLSKTSKTKKKLKSSKSKNEKKVSWILFLFFVFMFSLFLKLWGLSIITIITIIIIFFSIDVKNKNG